MVSWGKSHGVTVYIVTVTVHVNLGMPGTRGFQLRALHRHAGL